MMTPICSVEVPSGEMAVYVARTRQTLNVDYTRTGAACTFLSGHIPLAGSPIYADYAYT